MWSWRGDRRQRIQNYCLLCHVDVALKNIRSKTVSTRGKKTAFGGECSANMLDMQHEEARREGEGGVSAAQKRELCATETHALRSIRGNLLE